jgi:ankyrin repeat protein
MIKKLHSLGADLSLTQENGDTLLHIAARTNDLMLMDFVIANVDTSSQINTLDLNEETPALLAARN